MSGFERRPGDRISARHAHRAPRRDRLAGEVDLYLDIKRRCEAILADPELSDAPIEVSNPPEVFT